MADSFSKKERQKKKEQKRKAKFERKLQSKSNEGKSTDEFMYIDEFGNFTSEKPDPAKKRKIKAEDIEIGIPKKSEGEEYDPIRQGSVKFFNVEKGYGFILDRETNETFFVHVNNLEDEIMENDKVSFEVGMGQKGPIAMNVRLV